MKQTPFFTKSSFYFSLIALCLSVIMFSCASIKESPARYGYTITTMPGVQIKNSNNSVHAVLGYAHINFKGGGGHNNFFQVGGQFRQSLNNASGNGFWVGEEVTYMYIKNSIDNSSVSPHASAFTIGGLAGYRFMLGKLPMSIYGAPAFFHRGGFSSSGQPSSSGGNGFYGRLAFDIHFMSLLSKKGR